LDRPRSTEKARREEGRRAVKRTEVMSCDRGLLAAAAPKVARPARIRLIDPDRTELSTGRRGLAKAGSDLLCDPASAADDVTVVRACHLLVLRLPSAQEANAPRLFRCVLASGLAHSRLCRVAVYLLL
jgi:hypothetical protein